MGQTTKAITINRKNQIKKSPETLLACTKDFSKKIEGGFVEFREDPGGRAGPLPVQSMQRAFHTSFRGLTAGRGSPSIVWWLHLR
jgi:hypothetical protein